MLLLYIAYRDVDGLMTLDDLFIFLFPEHNLAKVCMSDVCMYKMYELSINDICCLYTFIFSIP